MPVCFQLTRKGDDKPAHLMDVDSEICRSLGEEVHETRWCRNWFNNIGLELACGRSWTEVRKALEERERYDLVPILEFLEQHYDVNAWRDYSKSNH